MLSRPVRARGLKHALAQGADAVVASRPVRARGLKHALAQGADAVVGRAPCGRVD